MANSILENQVGKLDSSPTLIKRSICQDGLLSKILIMFNKIRPAMIIINILINLFSCISEFSIVKVLRKFQKGVYLIFLYQNSLQRTFFLLFPLLTRSLDDLLNTLIFPLMHLHHVLEQAIHLSHQAHLP